MSVTAEMSVAALLEAAGLTLSPEETAEFVGFYPGYRIALDALYAVPMVKEEEPQIIFTPFV